VLALACRRGGRHRRPCRLELLGRRPRHDALERGLEAGRERLRRLASQAEPLGGAPQPVERCGRSLALAGRVGELLLGTTPLPEDVLEPRLAALALEPSRGPVLLHARQPLPVPGEVELRDSRLECRDLAAELLGPLGGGRLEGQRPQPLAHLRLEIAGTLDLHRDPRQLQLGPVLAALEAAEARCLLEQCATLLRLAREDLLDAPLADDRGSGRQAHLGEQLDQVDAPNRRPVEQILPLAAAVQPAGERDLGERQPGQSPVLVVEDELDLAEVRAAATGGAGEQHVVGLLGAQLGGRERARRPEQRVGDVRLPGAVRPDDDGDARLEPDLDRVRKRLEAAQAERAQVHACVSLTIGSAAASSLRARRVPASLPPAPRPSSRGRCRRRPARRR
jgi:hypothetical protein